VALVPGKTALEADRGDDGKDDDEGDAEQSRQEQLHRPRTVPPAAEILSGHSLNELLEHLQRLRASEVNGEEFLLSREVLHQVKVAPFGVTKAGLLRTGERLSWPEVLRRAAFATERIRLTALWQKARSQGAAAAGLRRRRLVI
jgi:hypothetical protein